MFGKDVLQRRHACRMAEGDLRVALLRLFLRVHGKLVRVNRMMRSGEPIFLLRSRHIFGKTVALNPQLVHASR